MSYEIKSALQILSMVEIAFWSHSCLHSDLQNCSPENDLIKLIANIGSRPKNVIVSDNGSENREGNTHFQLNKIIKSLGGWARDIPGSLYPS